MPKTWSYKNFEIDDGLKPGSSTFRYFFTVSESGEKKCNYCVWIVDEALSRFEPSKDFDAIAAAGRKDWQEWVRGKIDAADFRNRALKFSPEGQEEINLSAMKQHVW
ncbi:MAG: hypothetical protein WAL90_19550 [Desulfobacterales bacterium]